MRARSLTPDDAAAYVALRREMLLDAPWAFLADPDTDRGSDVEGVRASLARSDYGIAGVFDDGGRLVAAAGVVRESMRKRRHVAVVWGVYASPSARGRGAGRAVVSHALTIARHFAPPVTWAQLSVSARSPEAQALYASLGFVAWGREPDALRVDEAEGEAGADEVHMALRLRP